MWMYREPRAECRRVIGADASLTGYGGGLERTRWLLAHEGFGSPPCGVAAIAAHIPEK